MIRKKKAILWLAVPVVLLILGIAYLNRWNIALYSIGFPPSASMIYEGIDANGDNYRVVAYTNGEKGGNLALMTENRFGWWEATQVSSQTDQNELARISWMGPAGFRYAEDGKFDPDFEFHAVYCGNNAVGPVFPITEKLPPNVTVNVQQSGAFYLLHFVSFGPESPLNGLSVKELLHAVGAIS